MAETIDAFLAQAGAALKKGDGRRARGLLDAALVRAPDHAGAHHLKGLLDLQENDAASAVAHLLIAERGSRGPVAAVNLAVALVRAGRSDEAERLLIRTTKTHPDHAPASYNLGHLLLREGRPGEAEPRLRQAVAADPHYLAAWSDLGTLLLDLDRLDEAGSCFRRVLEIDPGHMSAVYNLALVDHRAGRFEQAVERFGVCRETVGLTREIAMGLGAGLQELGRYDAACEVYRELLARDPEAYVFVLRNLAATAKGFFDARPSRLRAMLGLDQSLER